MLTKLIFCVIILLQYELGGSQMAKKELDFVADKEQIRCLLSNIYDLQALRIAEGNRLVNNMYRRLGIEKPNSENDGEKETKKFIDILKADYKRIADAVAENNKSVTYQINEFNKNKKDSLKAIYHETDYKLVESYMLLLKSEEEQTKVLDKYVKTHPMWDAFFSNIKGCGTLMSAVCLAYLDPYKARHVSCFFKYCGLDTVQNTDDEGNLLFIATERNGNVKKGTIVRQKFDFIDGYGTVYTGKVKKTGEFDESGIEIFKSETGEQLYKEFAYVEGVSEENGEPTRENVYISVETGEEYVGGVIRSEHGRRMGDTVMQEYTDKDGNIKLKRGLSYNPFVKSKLIGVLSTRLLMSKDPTYSEIYYDYKNRLDNSRRYKDTRDGHKNSMALRYMIKQFLRNLWTVWRTVEGLPVDEPYEVEKLGNTPHKCNAYQCYVARDVKMTFEEFLESLEVEDDSTDNDE